MTIINQYITTFLSSYQLFKLMDKGFNIDNFKPNIFIATRNEYIEKTLPDYVFKEIEQELFYTKNLTELLVSFFDKLTNNLEIINDKIYVKEDRFEEWQEIVTKISPLMILSYYIYKHNKLSAIDSFKYSLLPSIYNKRLEYIFNNYQINDLHIHLNGTTEFDTVWQDLLKNSSKILKNYEKGFANSSVKEVYFEFGINDIAIFIKNIKEMIGFRKNYQCNYTIKCEMQFFINFFKNISNNNCSIAELNDFYKYILIYNSNYKLLVQQINQIGFDSFQKITNIEIREFTENRYSNRYQQVKTIYRHNNIKIEGRFAPKVKIKDFINILDTISIVDKDDINLVTHFIKNPDSNTSKVICRNYNLRQELNVIVDNLLYLLSKKKYKNIINGFDAAANELHARPEVFAPIFKKLKDKGYDNFTFHGGEDFIDLVSGIRYVYEIVIFLEFKNGNRIGHATSLGIEPKLWQSRVGRELYISQGEYLDNLIFVYYLSKKYLKSNKIIFKIEDEIYKYCNEIYNNRYHILDLVDAWLLRKEDPFIFFHEKKNNTKSVEIYERYHTDVEVIKRYNKKIAFNTRIFTHKELKKFQNIVLTILNNKNIIIESMITSNKIISFYKSYKEHHIARWLLKSPKPLVVIASDDPGIFATNLKNEFSHLYLILKEKLDNEEEIFNIIEKLIINSHIYKFAEGN